MEANAGKSFQMQILFNIFPRISLHCKLVPVQYWEYEYGLLTLHNIIFQVFTGNSDMGTIVSHKLVPRITSRYVRFYVMSWHNHISTRVELYGCVINGP